MAQKIVFDSGVKEYQVNGEVLRMNPSDPNLYARFFDAQEKLVTIEKELVEKGKTLPQVTQDAAMEQASEYGRQVMCLIGEADRKVKDLLGEVFLGNDFNKILGGVNVMATGDNGERVITNLLNALLPIIEEGAKTCADNKTVAAVTAARQNRAQRRAAAKR